ncbi:hypothetical protein [Streptomyces sp. NPDC000878]
MSGLIASFARLLRGFTAPSGHCHRIGQSLPVPHRRTPVYTRFKPPGIAVAPTVRPWYEPIDGTTTVLVRPYLAAYEHEETARLQRLRRDTPWFAAYGVDLDALDVHRQLEVA